MSEDRTAAVIDRSRAVAEEARADCRRMAASCLLDWYGVAVAGSGEPVADILAGVLAEGRRGGDWLGSDGDALGPFDFALLAGTAGHALDYDDTNMAVPGHTSATIVPGLSALARTRVISGERFLDAMVAGAEATCAVGRMLGPEHYAAGFHSTATAGVFGAAVAGAAVLGLPDDRRRAAIGLAASGAGGLKAQFGTPAKPFQVGAAAASGLRSALLAEAGMTATADGIGEFVMLMPGAGSRWEEPRSPAILGTLFKYHSSCHLSQATIEAALELRALGHRPESVASVQVEVRPDVLEVCNVSSPETADEARFSLPTVTALALAGVDTADPANFEPAVVRADGLAELGTRVTVVPAPAAPSQTWARMTLTDRQGQTATAESDVGVVEESDAAREERLTRKFLALTSPSLGERTAARVAAALLDIQTTEDVGTTMRAGR